MKLVPVTAQRKHYNFKEEHQYFLVNVFLYVDNFHGPNNI